MKDKKLKITIPDGALELRKTADGIEYLNNKAFVFELGLKILYDQAIAAAQGWVNNRTDKEAMEEMFLMFHKHFEGQPQNWIYTLNVIPLEKRYRKYELVYNKYKDTPRSKFCNPCFYLHARRDANILLREAGKRIKNINQI